ncbi:MAG: type II secretion system protein [Thermodesulfobacteriota bacterium]
MLHNPSPRFGRESGRGREHEAGFSFVELMVAMAIFGFAMLGAASMLSVANLSDRKNSQLRQAETAALGLIEEFSAGNPASRPTAGNAAAKGGYKAADMTTSSTDYSQIYYRWTSTSDNNLQRLDIIVGWGTNVCTSSSGTDCCKQDTPELCRRTLRISSYYQP